LQGDALRSRLRLCNAVSGHHDPIDAVAQVAEVDARVDIRSEPRIRMAENPLRDDERRARASE
jgi:hypothetical protein